MLALTLTSGATSSCGLAGIQEVVGVFLLEALNVGEQGENEHQDADDFTDRESHRGPPFFGKEGDY